ncbi:MAG: HlyD family type I secretion periplasmic adaptor subunit [Limnobacter sp.]|uniref:HlyD family type I secretion periplasmic adaptor subunit n=1 Tax=Limnobacter sp. TaxID=2003368 RepID=UPI003918BC0A
MTTNDPNKAGLPAHRPAQGNEVQPISNRLYEYRPDHHYDRVIERKSRVMWWIMGAMVILVTWAAFAEIDQVTRGSGQIIASSKTQTIQAPDGGVVEELNVREGDVVKPNQILAKLDTSKVEAAFKEAEAKRAALSATVVRLKAEVLNLPLGAFPPLLKDYPDIVQAQRLLFQRRQTAVNQEVGALNRTLALATKELDLNKSLLSTGDVSLTEVIRLERQISEIQAQITNRKNKYFQDSQAELAKAEEDLAAIEQTSAQRRASLDYTVLTAPVGGVVKNVRFTTRGAVLRAGDELLTIVPADNELIVEAKIKPSEIAFIKRGLPAKVKIDAYDYTIYGTLDGEVVYISADTLTEEGNRNAEQQTYYRVHVRTDGRTFKNRPNEQLDLIPGMTATVEVKTGNNTVLKYLIKPMVKTLNESLGER